MMILDNNNNKSRNSNDKIDDTISTFILKEHNTFEKLKRLLHLFNERIDNVKNPYFTLRLMADALKTKRIEVNDTTDENYKKPSDYMLYWPISKENTKLCICDTIYETSKNEECNHFHLVSIITLIKNIEKKGRKITLEDEKKKKKTKRNHFDYNEEKTSFVECKCTNHRNDIQLNWTEFVYPHFIHILLKKYISSTLKYNHHIITTTTTTENIDTNIENTKYPNYKEYNIYYNFTTFDFIVNTEAYFIKEIILDAFNNNCSQLYKKYKSEELTNFGKENLIGYKHFQSEKMTLDNYKLLFQLEDVKVKASSLFKGSIHIKSTNTYYVLFVSNGILNIPQKDDYSDDNIDTNSYKDKKYSIFVPSKKREYFIGKNYRYKKSIDLTELCGRDEICMIISKSRLIVKFKENSNLILSTKGKCKFDLDSCLSLELWSKDNDNRHYPFKYEINGDVYSNMNNFKLFINNREKESCNNVIINSNDSSSNSFNVDNNNDKNNEWLSYLDNQRKNNDLYNRYKSLFNNENIDIFISTHRVCFMYHFKKWKVSLIDSEVKPRFVHWTQYSSNLAYIDNNINDKRHELISKIKVYFRKSSSLDDKLPIFFIDNKRLSLSIRLTTYNYDKKLYHLHALYSHLNKNDVLAYFYISIENNFILFIKD